MRERDRERQRETESEWFIEELFQRHRYGETNLEERGVERGSARRSSLKRRERAIVNQTNIGTVSKATLGKLVREREGGAHMGFSERIDTIWN